MQTVTELVSQPPSLNCVERPLSEKDQFQQALSVANRYRSRDGTKSLQAIATNYIVISLCILISERAYTSTSEYLRASKHIIYVLACLITASRLRAFENLVHEASHLNLFASPSTHYSLQLLYSFPVFRVLEDYRASHLVHHQHLGDPTKDPDLIRILELGLDKVHEHPIYYLFILPLSGYIHFEYLTTTFTDFFTSRSAYPSKALFWAAVFGATAASSSTAYYLSYYYAVPFFVVLPITRFWAEAAEHLGMDMGSRFGHSRNNLGFGHRWYMHPHNDGYHAVHHIHSQVPFYHLPKAHAALMQENEGFRKEVVESWGIGETFWQMVSRKTLVKRTVSETVLGA